MLAASLLLTLMYAIMWHKHFDVHVTLIFAFIPISNLSNCLLVRAKTLEAAVLAQKLTYIGGLFPLLFIMLSVFSLCHINIRRWQRALLLSVTVVTYLSSLTIGEAPFFYEGVSFELVNGMGVLHKKYGIMHTVFYIVVVILFALSIAAMVYSYFRKKDVSRKMLYLLFTPELVSFLSFFLGRKLFSFIGLYIELLPFSYVFAQIMYLFMIKRLSLYDITDSAVDSLVQTGDTGFFSLDLKFRYLGSNETARRIFPELEDLTVDKPADRSQKMRETAIKWASYFRDDETHDKFYYEKDDRVYLVDINHLFSGTRKKGYQFVITDDTEDQKYISLLDSYNTDLKKQVEEKTAHITEMHDKLILGMATMVESRDNSTGGHIRRTSEVVRILIHEIVEDGELKLDEEFCRNIIKAAPMHDLGKIAVDDAILRKPGRFTDEEFAKMKEHAAEGARIVHEILQGTDDINFHILAENVAHYHHERWDGSGYPEGLKGEEIPLEARIMAIADVYDALVSKRVYKESMSFEQANAIIMDGMGKHFDKRLEKYYVKARPKLEAYYRENA